MNDFLTITLVTMVILFLISIWILFIYKHINKYNKKSKLPDKPQPLPQKPSSATITNITKYKSLSHKKNLRHMKNPTPVLKWPANTIHFSRGKQWDRRDNKCVD